MKSSTKHRRPRVYAAYLTALALLFASFAAPSYVFAAEDLSEPDFAGVAAEEDIVLEFAPLEAFAVAAEEELGALVSIAITTPPDKTEYYAGEEVDLTGLIVTASYDIGEPAAVTDYTATVTGNFEYEGLTLDATGVRTVVISYTEGGVTRTANFTVRVAGYELSYEYEFDLTDRLTRYTSNFQYTILDKMAGGAEFDKAWFMPGAVLSVYYTTRGASAEPDLRIAVLADVIGLQDNDTPESYNYMTSGGRQGDQKRIQSTLSYGYATGPGSGRALVSNSANTLQGTFENLYDEFSIAPTASYLRNYMADNSYDWLCVFSGHASNYSHFEITRVTLGWIGDGLPPWVERNLTSIAVTAPPDKTEYYAGEEVDLTGLVVTASYDIGGPSAVTDYTATVTGNFDYEGLTLDATGVRTVVISYTEGGVTRTANFTVRVAGYKLSYEYEFDLSNRLTRYTSNFQYTILDKMAGGAEFDKAWFTNGAVLSVYYTTRGASAEPDLRIAVLADVIGLQDNDTPETYNYMTSGGRQGDQKRIQSTLSYGYASGPGSGRALVSNSANTLQGTFENLYDEFSIAPTASYLRNYMADNSYDWLCVFSGHASNYSHFEITRATLGWIGDGLPPWVDGDADLLEELIIVAEANLANATVSADGSDVDCEELWVTREAYDLFAAAIDAAKQVLSDPDAVPTEIGQAVKALIEAEKVFDAAKTPGLIGAGVYTVSFNAGQANPSGLAVYTFTVKVNANIPDNDATLSGGYLSVVLEYEDIANVTKRLSAGYEVSGEQDVFECYIMLPVDRYIDVRLVSSVYNESLPDWWDAIDEPEPVTLAGVSNAKFVSMIETSKNSRIWTLTFDAKLTYSDGSSAVVRFSIDLPGNNANQDGKYKFTGAHVLAGYTLVYDVKGNGSNIKDFRIIK